jgi:uncharacterized membrane protein
MAFDAGTAWRLVSCLMLAWLAFFFGRTLRPGEDALITRIARVSDPDLPPHLLRYTRRLTAVWCAWFVCALCCVALARSALLPGPLVWAGTATLFLGEHWLRPHLFPGASFPGLRQQFRDTLRICRPARPGGN